jgi:phosphopantothenoylcysteine synthetase/decarboxylase
MRIVVTAGNTQAPIDRVRCLTNVFTGRTGAGIALAARARGHTVSLLTSHPEGIRDLHHPSIDLAHGWHVQAYQTFEQLEGLMQAELRQTPPDALVHSAAVSDYLVTGVYAPDTRTRFATNGCWLAESGAPVLHDRTAGKVKSDDPELWLRLTRAPKLIDRVRAEWGFHGLLVKFKLEVDVNDDKLLEIADHSRRQSHADFMVANTLDGAAEYAYLGPLQGTYQRVARGELANTLIAVLERAGEGSRG